MSTITGSNSGELAPRGDLPRSDGDVKRRGVTSARLGRRGRGQRVKGQTIAYMLLLPAACFYAAFQLFPIVLAFLLSLFHWNGIQISQLQFVGITHYRELFTDPVFQRALLNNGIMVVSVIVVQGMGSFLLAIGIYSGIPGARMFRVLVFIPVLLSTVAMGILGIFVFSPSFGLLDTTLRGVGLRSLAVPWLGSRNFALPAVILTYLFQNIGLSTILMLAGLQQVPRSVVEAARVDGATEGQAMRKVIFPVMRPVAAVVVLLAMVGAFRMFGVPYVLTNGGPYYASSPLVLYLYDLGFGESRIGYANTVGVVLFGIILVLAIAQLSVMKAGGTKD